MRHTYPQSLRTKASRKAKPAKNTAAKQVLPWQCFTAHPYIFTQHIRHTYLHSLQTPAAKRKRTARPGRGVKGRGRLLLHLICLPCPTSPLNLSVAGQVDKSHSPSRAENPGSSCHRASQGGLVQAPNGRLQHGDHGRPNSNTLTRAAHVNKSPPPLWGAWRTPSERFYSSRNCPPGGPPGVNTSQSGILILYWNSSARGHSPGVSPVGGSTFETSARGGAPPLGEH